MSDMAWTRFGKKKDMPGGLWIKCESCGGMLFRKEFEQRHRVCGNCGYHFTLGARERIALTADPDSFEEHWRELEAYDVLGFVDKMPYGEKLKATAKKTGEHDAVVTGFARIKGMPCALGVMNFAFLGGSMGMVVGEKIARLCEAAAERRTPVVLFACSGGARMHEGAVSLMQMAKTCGALTRLDRAGVVSISVLTHPTTGGVTASFASVCDLTIAEPGALIGFAGPRVIATTIKKELPKGFQRSEFLLEKGQIDRIVARAEMRDELARLLAYATGGDPVAAFKKESAAPAEAEAAEGQASAPATGTEPALAAHDEKAAKTRARRKKKE
ncbi:MAG: acetyl-CoA carboxylase carboxyltransferase subunit beta [Planctomycetes bacterium]|nr:acetyl-CoA carboxylase carboxyltransferase subunit beta [Planctomycetota bacterium]